YLVGAKIRGVEIVAETRYDSSNEITYTITWNSQDKKKNSVLSNKSASNVATLFFQLKALACNLRNEIESTIQLHNFYSTELKSIELNINELHVNFQNLNSKKNESYQLLDLIVCACDELLISRDRYHQLATIIPEMEHAYKVEEHCQEITKIMNNIIPVHTVQINSITPNRAYRSLKNILLALIPELVYGVSPTLHIGDIIYIKLSGDR
ncbi:16982_t:CDS:2, partial [Dentiscutata erythropus]